MDYLDRSSCDKLIEVIKLKRYVFNDMEQFAKFVHVLSQYKNIGE